jgi:hypothetical protein
MPRTYRKVLQFRVDLLEVPSPIWRVFQVPSTYTFWDLHVALQDAMGWEDRHLHEFKVVAGDGTERLFSIPDDEGWSEAPILAGWEHDVVDYMAVGSKAEYLYDFGDDWRHSLILAAVGAPVKGVRYPTCLAGEGACPPEDCGGPYAYADLLAGDADRLEWLGIARYEPAAFAPQLVRFSNPQRRWERAFGPDEE